MPFIVTKKWNYYNDFDEKTAAWARELIRRGLLPDGEVDARSILEVQPHDLRGFTQCHFFCGILGWPLALRMAGWPDDRPVWTGSPPCQPFSAAGRQKGKDDERHLAPHFASLVAACQPDTLFGEQVASAAVFGKTTGRSGKSVEGQAPLEWAWLDDLFERLEAAHYACGASDIPAAGVGAAHIRQRTFFGAQRLDNAAGPRHDGPFAGPEGLARNETWLRLSGAGSGLVGLANGAGERLEGRVGATSGQSGEVKRPAGLRAADGLADAMRFGQPGPGVVGRPSDPAAERDRQVGGTVNAGGRGGLAHPLHAGRPEWRPLAGSGSAAGSGGGTGGVADADTGSEGVVGNGGLRLGGGGSRDARAGHWCGCGNVGVADADGGQRGRVADGEGRQPNGTATGWLQGNGEPERGGECSGVVYADCAGQQAERVGPVGVWPEHETVLRGATVVSPATDAADLGWPSADWLYCRDGKWRPVEPLTFPLAYGLPARVGRLRGYGNAIVPQAAAEFIKAFDAASTQCFRLNDLSEMTTDNGVFG